MIHPGVRPLVSGMGPVLTCLNQALSEHNPKKSCSRPVEPRLFVFLSLTDAHRDFPRSTPVFKRALRCKSFASQLVKIDMVSNQCFKHSRGDGNTPFFTLTHITTKPDMATP